MGSPLALAHTSVLVAALVVGTKAGLDQKPLVLVAVAVAVVRAQATRQVGPVRRDKATLAAAAQVRPLVLMR